jgi:flagellar hook-associated protein 3 FlgL
MRITEQMRIAQTAQSLSRSARDLFELTKIASSGRKVNKPSDDPAVYAAIASRSEKLVLLDSRRTTLERAEGDMALAESALATAGDIMIRAREIAVAMANAEPGAVSRSAMAQEVSLLREQMIAVANSKGSRGYLFGGTATQTQPFTLAGVFQGNNADMSVEYADGQTVAVNISGQDTFTALSGGRDLFQDLEDLETQLNANSQQGVQALITNFAVGHTQVTARRAESGIKMNRFTSAHEVTARALVEVARRQAAEQEGDMTKVFSGLANAQVAYERSLTITRQVLAMATAMDRF